MNGALADREDAAEAVAREVALVPDLDRERAALGELLRFLGEDCGREHVAGKIADAAHYVGDAGDDLGFAGLGAGRVNFMFLDDDLQPRQNAALVLAGVLAEAIEFVTGENGALDGGADVLRKRYPSRARSRSFRA